MSRVASTSHVTKLGAWATASTLLWIARVVLSLWLVYPLLLAVQTSGMVSGPDGDAVLFRPGSELLLELLRVFMPGLASGLKLSLLFAALSALAELVPLAMALDILRLRARSLTARLGSALVLSPRFFGLSAITILAQVALLLAASLLAAGLKAALRGADERLLSAIPFALFGLGILACAAFGCVLDIARATLVSRECRAREALLWALGRFREQPFDVLLGGYVSGVAAAFAALGAAWFTTHLDLSKPSGFSLALTFAVHQFAILFAIGFRVRWLATALELSGPGDG